MKKLFENFLVICICVMLSLFYNINAYALNARIAFSDPSSSVGNEFDVTMKVSSQDGSKLGDDVVEVSYDASFLEFISGMNTSKVSDGKLKIAGKAGNSDTEYIYTLKFKALKAGETSLKVDSWGIYDSSNKMATLDKQGTSKITIAEAGATQAETTQAASTETSSESTNSESQSGETSSESLSESTAVSSDTGIVIDSVKYELASDFDSSILPATFEKVQYSYKGKNVAAGKQADGGALLMYLLTSDGSGNLFFYDETSDSWSKYVNFTVAAKTFTSYPLPKDVTPPKGFIETTLNLNGVNVTGWLWATDTDHNYALIYGMNVDGEKKFYRYDLKEKTIQRYFEDPSIRGNTADYSDTVSYYKALQKAYDTRGKKLYIAAAILFVLILVAAFIGYRLFILSRNADIAAKNALRNIKSRRQRELQNQENQEKQELQNNRLKQPDTKTLSNISSSDDTANGARKYKVTRTNRNNLNQEPESVLTVTKNLIKGVKDEDDVKNVDNLDNDKLNNDKVDNKVVSNDIENLDNDNNEVTETKIKREVDIYNTQDIDLALESASKRLREKLNKMNLREKGAESEDELGKSNIENSNIENLDVENLDAENFDIENLDSKLYNVDSLNEIKSDIKDLDKDLDDENLDIENLDTEDNNSNLNTENLDNKEESNTENETVSDENDSSENVSNDNVINEENSDENSLVDNVLEEQNLYYEKKFGKDSNEYKILKDTPSFTNEWNLGFFGETFEEMFPDEGESIPETISSIENALAENLDKDNTVPIEDENYKVAKESEEKANKESKFDTREF